MKIKEYLLSLMSEKEAHKLIKAAQEGKIIVVTGRQVPSGKTTLVKILKEKGYTAVEMRGELSFYHVVLDKQLEKLNSNIKNEVDMAWYH